MNAAELVGSIEIGMVFALVAFGVLLTFRVINFPDLTVDGSFALGAAIASVTLVHNGNPWMALVLATAGGFVAGITTGLLFVWGRIMDILCGILTMTALYSINLRIMKAPNLAFMEAETVFFAGTPPLVVLAALVVSVGLGIVLFFKTHAGLAVRAVGINKRVSQAYGIRTARIEVLTIGVSNALVAMAGALFCQIEGFADISMGIGTVIVGLASVVIGETLIPGRSMLVVIFRCMLGAIAYRVAISFALNASQLGLQSSDLNLLTTLLVLVVMILPRLKKKWAPRVVPISKQKSVAKKGASSQEDIACSL